MTDARLFLATATLAVGFCILDLYMPLGYSGGAPYVLPVLLTLWSRDQRPKLLVALFCSALLVLGWAHSDHSQGATILAWNRSWALLVIWATAWFSALRTKAEQELVWSEKRFREFAGNVYAILSIGTADGLGITYVSPAYEAIWGRSCESLYSDPQSWMEAVHPDDRARVRQSFFTNQAQGSYHEQYRVIRPDGGERWVDARTFPIRDGAGQVRSVAGIIDDITDRKRAELALQQANAELESRVAKRTADLRAANEFLSRETAAREQAEERALESEQQARGQLTELEQVYRTAPVGLAFLDTELRFVRINERLAGMDGATVDNHIGRRVRDLVPEIAEQIEPIYRRVIETGTPVIDQDIRATTPAEPGTERDWLVSIHRLESESGSIQGANVAVQDVTEIKHIERRLLMTQFSVDHAGDSVLWLNPAGRFAYVNEAACRTYGYSNAEFLTLAVHDIDPGVTAETWPRQWETVKKQGSLALTTTHRDKQDRVFPVEITASYLKFDRQEFHCAVVRDISERKRAEEALLRSEARFRRLFESNLIGAFFIRDDGTITDANDAFLDLVGFSREELRAGELTWEKVTPPEWRILDEEAVVELKQRSVAPCRQKEYLRKDGSRVPVLIGRALLQESDHEWVSFVLDLSERERAEARLRQSLQDLARAQQVTESQARDLTAKNSELEQFAYIASHDLQEPLRSVSGYAQLLQRRYQGLLDASADEFIDFLVQGVERMKRLIEGLLEYSRTGRKPLSMEDVDCDDCVSASLANLRFALEETNAEVVRGRLPKIPGDRTRLIQLFQNLIGNALKYRGPEPPRVKIEVEPSDTHWHFSIQDNGIGIDPQFHERIFEMFQRLHAGHEHPGTGIGLALCKRIVERHGGRLWVESRTGQGATFHFTLAKTSEAVSA